MRELPDSRDPTDTGFNPFGPEEVEAFELGLKSELFERRLRLNVSAFVQNYEGKQIIFQKDTVSNTRVFNLDDRVQIKGAELESTWLATRSLKLSLSGTWLQDNVEDAINPLNGLRESWRLAQIPKFRWAGSVDYLFPVNPMAGDLNLFVSLTGSTSYCFNEQSCLGRFEQIRGGRGRSGGEHNDMLEARLALTGIEIAGGRVDVALWGKNLLDRSSYQTGFAVPGLNTGIVNYGEPRAYGVSATYEFGSSR